MSTNTGNYLDAHPETNTALTNAAQAPGPQAVALLKTYFDANPQVSTDLQSIAQPLAGLSGECKLPITIPQALGLIQALSHAEGSGQLPGGLNSPAGVPLLQGPTAPVAGAAG